MAQKNCSIVMDLGLPQTKPNLDSRTSPHRHMYEALLSQYLDEDDHNVATFASPDHVFGLSQAHVVMSLFQNLILH
jgi:hypothetical protein